MLTMTLAFLSPTGESKANPLLRKPASSFAALGEVAVFTKPLRPRMDKFDEQYH